MLDESTTEPAAEPVQETEPVQAAGDEGTPVKEDTFMDPSQLPPELQAHFKRMQGAYTKKMQQVASVREAARLVSRFNSDPDFARQTIMERAQQLGLNIGQTGQPQAPGLPMQQGNAMPQGLVDAVKATLSPELQWMAPALAASQWAGMQMALQPIKEQQAQTMRQTQDSQFEVLAEQLSQKAPGWEEHEDDMDSLLAFMHSNKMTDRRWGSKLELLHKLATAGDGHATAQAARRMAEAARNGNPAGRPMAQPVPNVGEQVKKAKTNQDAWDAAAKAAMAEMARNGIKVS